MLTEEQIKKIAKAEYWGLNVRGSYPNLTLDFVKEKVREILDGKVEGVIAMSIKRDMEDAGLLDQR